MVVVINIVKCWLVANNCAIANLQYLHVVDYYLSRY